MTRCRRELRLARGSTAAIFDVFVESGFRRYCLLRQRAAISKCLFVRLYTMQQGAVSGSEKSSSSSGGHSICSRSDDEKHPTTAAKVSWTADSEEAWPTLCQSQEQSAKKKSTKGSSTPRDKTSSSIDRSRKPRHGRRGVPLAPEDRDQMFYHAKQDRLLKGFRNVDKDKGSHRRSATQTEIRLNQGGSSSNGSAGVGVSKNKESGEADRAMEPSPGVTTVHPQTPREATHRFDWSSSVGLRV